MEFKMKDALKIIGSHMNGDAHRNMIETDAIVTWPNVVTLTGICLAIMFPLQIFFGFALVLAPITA
ncbi:hypothetical protein L0Y69_01145, partial [bacterium]|nr:hypothetical protein [bacterium]